jgi:hypothetical protein
MMIRPHGFHGAFFNSVNLLELARQYGYELENKERKAFHAKHSGGLYFYKDSNAFKHFGSDTKMNEKKLYQGTYFNKAIEKFESVCAFVGYDENGKARYCAMRGADPDSTIKNDKSGSDKGIPFHITCRSNKVYVLESPIDAASHATLAMLYDSFPI